MDFLYKVYCMTNMLIDKSIHTYNYNNKTIRMKQHNKSMFNQLYDLTYEPTHIEDNIYLGNAYNARDYYWLKTNNIGLIVNCTVEISDYFNNENEFQYYRIPVLDINGENIKDHVDNVLDAIDDFKAKNEGKNILIHCFMGSSRSAAIVISYLINRKNMKLSTAIECVTNKRPIVNLNIDFYKQLLSCELEPKHINEI